jgi:hypothetical protein
MLEMMEIFGCHCQLDLCQNILESLGNEKLGKIK